MIALRKAHPALIKGALIGLAAAGDLLRFERRHGGERLFCAFNMGEAPVTVALPRGGWESLEGPDARSGEVKLQAWGVLIARQA
jgi:alpha-glucosidase